MSHTHATTEDVLVHEEDLTGFVACAVAARKFPELELEDPTAEALLRKLGLDVDHFDDRRLRATIMRTRVVDSIVREFFERNPDGLAVGLFPGLSTRFNRVDNGSLHWLDLEQPPVAAFIADTLPGTERHVIAPCCSLACNGVLSRLAEGTDVPMLLIGCGVLRRAKSDVRDGFFTSIAQHLPTGTELVLDYDERAPLRPSSLAPNASMSALGEDGTWIRYPRIRFVPPDASAPRIAHELAGVNAIARLFRGRGTPAIAHVRLA